MKKKQIKKEKTSKKQIVEIHIYIHQNPVYINPNGSGTYNPPFYSNPIVTCGDNPNATFGGSSGTTNLN